MVNRLELAKRIVEEQRQQQPDLVAAWLVGSVARSEDTESSDIDIAFVVAGDVTGDALGYQRTIDGWFDGIYVEAATVSTQQYTELVQVMNDAFKVTHMNDALILYDPTGHFMRLQQEVRAIYMQPEWLRKRLQYWLDWARKVAATFPESVASEDSLAICKLPGYLTFAIISIHLLRAGITPSSTRGLVQLGAVNPIMHSRMVDFFGAASLHAGDVVALASVAHLFAGLVKEYGKLPEYFVQKSLWLAQNGFHQEALYPLWQIVTDGALACEQDHTKVAEVTPYARRWLEGVGWHGSEVLAAKVQEALALLQQAEAVVATV